MDHVQSSQEIYLLGGSVDLEIARLSILERLRIENMGGVCAERNNDFTGFTRVLDLVSRTGTWALQVARDYPELEVISLDWPGTLADIAQGQAEVQGLANIRFHPQGSDITRLDFPDSSFDLINASQLFSFVLPQQWPAFLKECLRITRPGGAVRFIEGEWGTTNSPAIEEFTGLFLRGLKQMGHSLSPNGRNIGVVTVLAHSLEQIGWQKVTRRAYIEEYMTGQRAPANPQARVQLMANTMLKPILSQGLSTQTEVDALLAQAVVEVADPDFCGVATYYSFYAQKPA